jgi:filamin
VFAKVNDTAKVLVTETLEKVSVNKMASFVIEADSTPTVDVLAPTRESLPVQIDQTAPGSYTAGFTPKDVGRCAAQSANSYGIPLFSISILIGI